LPVGGPGKEGGVDPISIVVAALVAGASAGLTDTVAGAIRDAYGGLKGLLLKRFPGLDVSAVERMPASEHKRESLKEDLAAMGGVSSSDSELLDAAERLVQAVKSNAPEAAAAVGVDLKEVEAGALRIRSVRSSGTGVRVEQGLFHGDIEIGGVQAGQHGEGIEGPADPSTARQ
jgi:hypothetical protein